MNAIFESIFENPVRMLVIVLYIYGECKNIFKNRKKIKSWIVEI